MGKKKVIQRHHISYKPEVMVPIYKGEHFVLLKLNSRKYVSKGFITSLKVWIALREGSAQDLTIKEK